MESIRSYIDELTKTVSGLTHENHKYELLISDLEYNLAVKTLDYIHEKEENIIKIKVKDNMIDSLRKDNIKLQNTVSNKNLQHEIQTKVLCDKISELEKQLKSKIDTINMLFEENCKLEEKLVTGRISN